jgi:hypothetical protein
MSRLNVRKTHTVSYFWRTVSECAARFKTITPCISQCCCIRYWQTTPMSQCHATETLNKFCPQRQRQKRPPAYRALRYANKRIRLAKRICGHIRLSVFIVRAKCPRLSVETATMQLRLVSSSESFLSCLPSAQLCCRWHDASAASAHTSAKAALTIALRTG